MRRPVLALALLFLPTVLGTQDGGEPAAIAGSSTSPAPLQQRIAVLPYLGYAPESGVQYGATTFVVRQPGDSTRPSTAQLFAAYTAKSQMRVFAEIDRWTTNNTWRLNGRVEWQRFPLPYFGSGDDTPESAEEIYTPRGWLAVAIAQRRISGPLYAVGGYRYQDVNIVETEDGGELASGTVVGSRGGRVAQLVGGALWDSRDHALVPYNGTFVQITGMLSDEGVGSEFDFSRFVLDARHYLPVGDRRIVAIQGVVETTGGRAPFDQISLVGNSNYLRGYARGRFRDQHLASVQAEYRAPIVGRLGWAAFGGVGRVATNATDLFGGEPRLLPSYGLGARWVLFASSRSTVRVDYARGADGQSGVYVAFNEAY